MANDDIEISVVIPVYRSERSLEGLVSRLTSVLTEMGVEYEILLVDDDSPDDSWRVMQRLHSEDAHVKIIQHTRNFGQHKAILCGMRYSTGKLVVTMDDDLQHPPEEIPKLVEAITNDPEVDVVIGAYDLKQHSWFRNLGSRVVNVITSHALFAKPGLQLTSFRIVRRLVVDELVEMPTRHPRVSHMLLAVTNRVANVPVAHCSRAHGRSGYSAARLVSNALDTILSNSSLPLQIVSCLGFASSLFSLFLSCFYLGKYMFVGVSVPGWTTTILLMLFFFGILLFSFGVVGEYLVRILREVQGSSRSVVRKKEL